MAKIFASIISILLHPMLMPTYGMLMVLGFQSQAAFIPSQYQSSVLIITILSTCILPLSSIPIFLQLKVIKSVQMETKEERIFPMMVTCAFFMLGNYFLNRFNLPWVIQGFYIGSLLVVLSTGLITLFWKISIHAAGIGGLFGAILALGIGYGVNVQLLIIIAAAISGILVSCRLYLGAHTPAQVYSGFLLGSAIIFFLVMLGYFL